jgi:hypothetical protein
MRGMDAIPRVRAAAPSAPTSVPRASVPLGAAPAKPVCGPRRAPLRPGAAALWLVLTALAAAPAHAQALGPADVTALFPPAPQGEGTAPGVTVRSRTRTLYDPRGVQVGLLEAYPRVDLGLGYDSDPTGQPHGKGGFEVRTAPSVTIGAGWGVDRAGLLLALDDRRVMGVAAADRTDWTVAAGLGLGFGPDRLRLSAAQRALHEDGSEIGALPTDRPLPYRVTALQAAGRIGDGRISLTPAIGLAAWRYDPATLAGVAVSQTYRNRDVAQGNLLARYTLMPRTDLVLVLRGTDTRYVAPQPATPARDSTGFAVLAGAEGGDGIVHLRLLVGWEERDFAAPAYGRHAAPIAEAEATWRASGMTTVTATLWRRIEDAAQEGVAGFTETAAALRVDREARRNLLISLSAGIQTAAFTNGGGTETGTRFGASVTWLLNRRMRLVATEALSTLHGSGTQGTAGSGSVTRSLSLLTLGFGL